MSRTRKVHVKSFGCQMNVYDSHRMADTLAPAGYSETADAADADLVILNTCNIREKAAEKVYSEIGRIRVLKEEAARARPPHADRGRRLRGAGRRARNHPPRRRGRSGGRLAELSPAARTDRARASGRTDRRHRISGRRQVRRAGRAATRGNRQARHFRLRHRAGRLRQVLHVLRGALHARRRSLAPGRKDRRRSRTPGRKPACAR